MLQADLKTGLLIVMVFVTSYGMWKASQGNYYHQAVLSVQRFGEGSFQNYIISNDSSDFNEAESTCKAQEGGEYALAYVIDEKGWIQFTSFMRENGQDGAEYWIGGAYDTTKEEFCWVDIHGSREERVFFAPFLYSHFDMEANTTEPNSLTCTILVNGHDKSESKISTRMFTSTRRFICQRVSMLQ